MDNQEKYKIAIIGLGYVGLPLAVEFSKKYQVLGFDILVVSISWFPVLTGQAKLNQKIFL